jgi:hypothetical protein
MAKLAILGCGYVGSTVVQYWRRTNQGHSTNSNLNPVTTIATTRTPARLAELEAIADRPFLAQGNDPQAISTLLREPYNPDILLICLGAGRNNLYEQAYLQTAQTLAQVLDPQLDSPLAPQLTPPLAPTPNNLPGSKLKQIIYTSSCAVYGDHQGAWVTETSDLKSTNTNGEILIQTERVLLDLATAQRRVCILRLAGIYGPNRSLDRIFGSMAGTTRPGDGQEPSNWVHLDDIVGAIVFAQTHGLGGVYNLVNDNPLPRRKLAQWICETYGLAPIHWDPTQPSRRALNVRLSNQKLKNAGYSLKYPRIQ